VDYAVGALVIVGIAYLILRRRRSGRAGAESPAAAEPAADAPR
jgi:hypothetical protein